MQAVDTPFLPRCVGIYPAYGAGLNAAQCATPGLDLPRALLHNDQACVSELEPQPGNSEASVSFYCQKLFNDITRLAQAFSCCSRLRCASAAAGVLWLFLQTFVEIDCLFSSVSSVPRQQPYLLLPCVPSPLSIPSRLLGVCIFDWGEA
jgi:hypothetical protein